MQMRWEHWCFALAAFAPVTDAGTFITVNDNGDGAAACPATCTLRQAIADAGAGGTILFAQALASPIVLTQGELLVDKAVTIEGPGADVLTVSAQNNSRVMNIAASAEVRGLEIADGAVTGGNGADGAGAPGGSAVGACVYVASGVSAVLDRVAVRHCQATGGAGGSGAAGTPGSSDPMNPIPGGPGGSGGQGGMAAGAAIAVDGSLTLSGSSVVDAHGTGGTGGSGGPGGFGIIFGPGGIGGPGGEVDGGAVRAGDGASLRILNSTIAESSGTGGSGGIGGFGTPIGMGGSGGFATGGLLSVGGAVLLADLEFSTLVNGSVTGGAGGIVGGPGGIPSGNAISAGSTLNALSSIVVGAQSGVTLCYGSVSAASGSHNLGEDDSCGGFDLQATFAQTLRPVDVAMTPWPGYLPMWQGPAIDAAASCEDLAAQLVALDQHGINRPQRAACDLGAIEADYVFVGGFE